MLTIPRAIVIAAIAVAAAMLALAASIPRYDVRVFDANKGILLRVDRQTGDVAVGTIADRPASLEIPPVTWTPDQPSFPILRELGNLAVGFALFALPALGFGLVFFLRTRARDAERQWNAVHLRLNPPEMSRIPAWARWSLLRGGRIQ